MQRRNRRKSYFDKHEEMMRQMVWAEVEMDAKEQMTWADKLPPKLGAAIGDCGADCQVAMNWYRHFLRTNPPETADRLAAETVRKLAREYEQAEMEQAGRELQAAGRALARRLRR